jgi:hypothetical protein
MKYKIFSSPLGIITAVPENDHLKQVAQLQFGDKEVGEFDESQYKDGDEALIRFIEKFY